MFHIKLNDGRQFCVTKSTASQIPKPPIPKAINPINSQSSQMRKLLIFVALLLISTACFSQSRYISVSTKKMVYARDGGSCRCCGSSSNLEYDHITPFSCGGSSDASNIQLLCFQCNRSKSNSCTCKVHDRTVGTNCCDKSKSKSKKSSSPTTQCTGTTKKGNRCKNKTSNSSGRCHLH